ncbi:leucine-rich repeat-containing protein, partial [Tanacetum coccineum]
MLTGEIPTSLFKIRTLTELFIGGKGSKLIWNNTTKVDPRCSLEYISVTSCGISGQIPEWISSQKELEDLDLSGNKLEGRFPHWLAEMNNIQYMYLSDNNLNGQIPPRLFESDRLSGNLPVLGARYLDLSDNDFSSNIPTYFPNRTEILYLGRNKFSGSLPINLTKLVNLRVLDLHNSIITGNLQDILPQIPTLEILILRNTFLNG